MTLIEKFDGNSWTIVSSANPSTGNQNTLLSVACTTGSNCRTAGSAAVGNAQQSLIERYAGISWLAEDSANTDPGQSNFPYSLTCNSVSDCWLVGSYFNYPGSDVLTLIDHYDGFQWSVVDSPNPPPNSAGQHTDFLTAVTCRPSTDCWAVGYYFSANGVTQTLIERYTVPAVQLNAVVSRKVHGGAGTFDVDLSRADECRSGGPSGNYTLVFNFASPLMNVGDAKVSGGTATIAGSSIGSDSHEYVVNLTGVANAQTLNISVNNVADSAGNFSAVVSASMSILVGDTNGDRFTDAIDVSQTKSQSGNAVTTSNFREDVNVDGFIDAIDVSVVKSKSGTALP